MIYSINITSLYPDKTTHTAHSAQIIYIYLFYSLTNTSDNCFSKRRQSGLGVRFTYLQRTIGASTLLGVVRESLAATNLPYTRVHKGYS